MSEGKLHPHYLGIKSKIGPERLKDYEGLGYVLEEKHDGWWACLEVGPFGDIHTTTRRNNPIKEAGFPKMSSELSGVTIVGEWLPKTGEVWVWDLLVGPDNVHYKLAPFEVRRYKLWELFGRFVFV